MQQLIIILVGILCLGLTITVATATQSDFYDVVIIGSGPAGLTAALFAARAGLSTLVLGSDAGSSLSEAALLDNFPGFGGDSLNENGENGLTDGSAWLQQTKRKAMKAGAKFAQAGLMATNLQRIQQPNLEAVVFQMDVKTNTTTTLKIRSRSVVLAMGATEKKLGLPLEDEMWGKSIHSCAVCDGSSYSGQVVMVVGGGDAAVDAALLLARYAKRVILVHRREEFRAKAHLDLLQTFNNIQIVTPYVVNQLHVRSENGKNGKPVRTFTGARLQNTETSQTQNVHCDGVFVMIGSLPNTDWLKGSGIELDQHGYIMLDRNDRAFSKSTSIPGVFVAGEATDQLYRQAITAAAEGAQAAMDAERWLRTQTMPASMAISSIPKQTIPLQRMEEVTVVPEQHTGLRGQEQRNTQEQPLPIACNVSQKECLDSVVNEHPLVVFSTARCPQCHKLKETLALEGITEETPNVNIINLSKLGTSKINKVRAYLKETTGRKSFPSVFLGGKWIAGEAQTTIWQKEGKLREMFVEAGVFNGANTVDGGQEEL